MKSNGREIPIEEKRKFQEADYGYLFPSVSGTDMTGLIPSGVREGNDLQSYDELYPFLADSETVTDGKNNKSECW